MSFLKTILEANDIWGRYGSSFIRGSATLFANSLFYISNRPLPRGPLFVAFDITFKCNSKCFYCDRWKIK
ncbi:MAG: hypothetical protein V1660_04630 [archaeon]